ncbi:MAG TPA: hypothetical protein VFH61_10785 [Thermoleophilia bacterium]|nr:hypothetical protein [Thermoleophilia bacterium]
MDKCRYCDAAIIWSRARTSKRWLPLDAVRVERGVRFIIDEDGTAHTTNIGSGHTLHTDTCAARQKPGDDDSQGTLALDTNEGER